MHTYPIRHPGEDDYIHVERNVTATHLADNVMRYVCLAMKLSLGMLVSDMIKY